MTISLYDTTVAGFLQVLGATAGFLERGRAHAAEHGIDPAALAETRLYPDMLPLHFQARSVAHHSLGAIEGVRRGSFSPPAREPLDYPGLQRLVAEAERTLKAVEPAEIESFRGRDVLFVAGERRVPFLAEGFLCPSRCPTCISTRPPPTTFCA